MSLDKVSNLARYYDKIGSNTPRMYCLVSSLQATRIYISLKTIVLEMVSNPTLYIPTKKEERIMKSILGEYLVDINENMKSIILNKYFVLRSVAHGVPSQS